MKTIILSLVLGTAFQVSPFEHGSMELPTTHVAVTRKCNERLVTTFASVAPPSLMALDAKPAFAWKETVYDFGKIRQNQPVTHEFRFVNNGAEPLIITGVKASCGCTVAKHSQDAIAPGSEGFVTATYNATAKGVFNKTITVNANTQEGVVVLSIRGEVE